VTAAAIHAQGQTKIGLLGTRFTMEQDFYKGRLQHKHGIEVVIPEEQDRQIIHTILYDELCLGEIKQVSKEAFRRIIADLEVNGAQGVVLGCTEIPLIVKQEDYSILLYDTTTLHAVAAVEFALKD
jgi:aspartate racemase